MTTLTPSPAPRRRRLRTTGIVAAAVLAVTAPMAVLVVAPRTAGPPRAATFLPTPAAPTTITAGTGAAAMTAQQRLLALADHITPVPADEHSGGIEYTHVQLWARATTVVARLDTTRWRAVDGCGRITDRRLPDRTGLTRPPTSAEHRQLLTAPADVEDYRPGRLPPEIMLPIVTGPNALAAQFFTISP